jgi:vancomycin resistance protein YoaR
LDASARVLRARARKRRLLVIRTAITVGVIALVATLVGLVFAGSSSKLPEGVQIANIDVGGLKPSVARETLERRSRAVATVPVTFRAAGETFALTARRLEVAVNWDAAVSAAQRQGEGPVPVRGLRRLGVRLFGADVTPAVQAYDPALQFELDRIAIQINSAHRDAALRLVGGRPVVVAGAPGSTLDRAAAARVIVQALASLQRPATVELPVKRDPPAVTAVDLRPALVKTRIALSAPVELRAGKTTISVPPYRIAHLLDLPSGGRTDLRIGGLDADSFFRKLGKTVSSRPHDARFEPVPGSIKLVPATVGRAVNGPATADTILRAALSRVNRTARLVVEQTQPKLTTAAAKEMGIKEIVGEYTTEYGGIANRIHNVQLVAHLIDNHYVKPGQEFSFNNTTGERTADKGFLEAPVIINGELQTGLGGGVCQVSTTLFNAAYEAGLKITSRTNHALYISHYPLGRDATVNYPDTDLRFVNDTDHWLLLRTFVGSSSLTVVLYGTSPHRKVETSAAPLVTTGGIPIKKTKDPELALGEKVIEEYGAPSRATSVERKVYSADGDLLYDNTWYSSYRGEYRVVRIGTKAPEQPVEKPAKKKKDEPATTTTETTTTTPL